MIPVFKTNHSSCVLKNKLQQTIGAILRKENETIVGITHLRRNKLKTQFLKILLLELSYRAFCLRRLRVLHRQLKRGAEIHSKLEGTILRQGLKFKIKNSLHDFNTHKLKQELMKTQLTNRKTLRKCTSSPETT